MDDKMILELTNVMDDSTLEESERLLRSFYRTIEPHKKRNWKNPQRISWEIYAEKDKIGFYVVCPHKTGRLIKSRIKDAYPNAEIIEVDDPTNNFNIPFTAEMKLHKHHMFATKMNAGDSPLNSILNSMSRLEEDEKVLLQISMLPINNTWQGKAYAKYRDMLFRGIKPKKPNEMTLKNGILYSIGGLFRVIEYAISSFIDMGTSSEQKNTPIERQELKATQQKISLPAFNTSIRMAVESKDQNIMSTRLSELTNSFIELDADNEWRRGETNRKETIRYIRERKVERRTNNILTTQELSPIVRLHNSNIKIPELKQALKTQAIPQGLSEGLYFANGLHNSTETPIFISEEKKEDLVHPTIYTGGMGGGKTTAIINNMLARALEGYSTILIDTQGDMSTDFISQLPESEHERIVHLNFGDLANPVPLDMLEFVSLGDSEDRVDEMFVKDIAKNELISIFKKMFGANLGPQSEYILRCNIQSCMDVNGTFMEMFRMLVDDSYRDEVVMQIKHSSPFAYAFWQNFQTNFSLPQKMKMVMPLINKIGSFVESPMIRNITSQGKQNYNFREMMDTGKIVIVTIPKGVLVGTWQLIASLVISKVWLASLTRANQPIHERKPCFLASDEADDIINDNFPIMLSQSRKFRLGIHLGFQYLDQIKSNNKKVFNAIVGNKPNYVSMKCGEKDLDFYAEIFKGYYTKDDLRAFPNLHGVAQLSINGQPTTPFTIKIPFNFYKRDNSPRDNIAGDMEVIADRSRKLYARPLAEVEDIVAEKYTSILSAMTLNDDLDMMEYEAEVDEATLKSLSNII